MTAINLQLLTAEFAEATAAMELAWAKLKADKENQRLLARYVRKLNTCNRLRAELKHLMDTGNL